jgi:hypothetical protein
VVEKENTIMSSLLDTGVTSYDTTSFDTSFASAGSDPSGTIDYYIPPADSLLTARTSLLNDSTLSAGSGNLFTLEPDPNGLLTPTQPAPQSVTAGTDPGTSWSPLLGFGAPIVSAEVGNLLKSGALQPGGVQLTGANGASVGSRAAGNPLKVLFDTTNQGVTGQHIIFVGIALLALIYAINKLS